MDKDEQIPTHLILKQITPENQELRNRIRELEVENDTLYRVLSLSGKVVYLDASKPFREEVKPL